MPIFIEVYLKKPGWNVGLAPKEEHMSLLQSHCAERKNTFWLVF